MSATPDAEPLRTPCGRAFTISIPTELLQKLFRGSFKSTWRGVPMLKNALDLMIYMQVLERMKPNSVIEIGSKNGGSALWFADMISATGRTPSVVSVDLALPKKTRDPRIRFLEGDALNLGAVLTEELLDSLPRPWLVTEDSAHIYDTTRAVLDFFEDRLRPGELIVVEDGFVSELPDEMFRVYDNGPNRAVAAFLEAANGRYAVDERFCDFFGYNATANPNGWLKRV